MKQLLNSGAIWYIITDNVINVTEQQSKISPTFTETNPSTSVPFWRVLSSFSVFHPALIPFHLPCISTEFLLLSVHILCSSQTPFPFSPHSSISLFFLSPLIYLLLSSLLLSLLSIVSLSILSYINTHLSPFLLPPPPLAGCTLSFPVSLVSSKSWPTGNRDSWLHWYLLPLYTTSIDGTTRHDTTFHILLSEKIALIKLLCVPNICTTCLNILHRGLVRYIVNHCA